MHVQYLNFQGTTRFVPDNTNATKVATSKGQIPELFALYTPIGSDADGKINQRKIASAVRDHVSAPKLKRMHPWCV